MNINTLEVFQWSENFKTGYDTIDEQHQELVNLLNQLANTLTFENHDNINDAFVKLAEYAKYHFEEEEKIWGQYLHDDPWYQEHIQSHASFLPKVLSMQENSKNRPFEEGVEEIVMFLIRWLAFHIIDEDQRLAHIINFIKNGESIPKAKELTQKQMNNSIQILINTILKMHESISSRTINLMKEHNARIEAENRLKEANEELKRLSITDQLTQLFNRRHFETLFESELNRAKRSQTYLTLIYMDLDYFKGLNDFYGHSYGDEALKKVAQAMKSVCKRPSDFAFRIGGEEFTIICNSDNQATGVHLAHLLQEALMQLKILNEKSKVSQYLTASMGVTSKIPSNADTMDSFVNSADKKLYASKESGRNKITSE